MGISLEDYAQQVIDSHLMSADDVSHVLANAHPEFHPLDGKQLARLLVKLKKLTAFQAQQIYSGKGKLLILGNYIILDKLGQGGMGMVLKAKHRRMKRIVALKVLSPALMRTSKALKRFQREVETAAKLHHANIVTAFDADKVNGTRFLVMEYVEGADLHTLVKEDGPLSVEKAVFLVLEVARGMEYVHAHGLVHRDIKPSNLLLSRNGTVKILDLGLARVNSTSNEQNCLTMAGQMMGTVEYMAPEQAIDTKAADARADIYSLGATLWFLITGRAVYDGDTVAAKVLAHRNWPIPSLRDVCPHVSPTLDGVFARMVAKTPELRYQSMTEVIADLTHCMEGCIASASMAAAPWTDTKINHFPNWQKHSDDFIATNATWTIDTTGKGVSLEPTAIAQPSQIETAPETPQIRSVLLSTAAKRRRSHGFLSWQTSNLGIVASSIAIVVLWYLAITFM